MTSTDIGDTTTSGFAALNRNDPGAARQHFERAIAAGAASALTWYGLSRVLLLQGADEEEGAALDRALDLDGNYMQALIAKADWHVRRKNTRTADSFYKAAVDVARTVNLPPFWRAEVERAKRVLAQSSEAHLVHLRAALEGKGLGEPGTERFAQALDLLLGERKLYLQKPTHFYFPGLPQLQFYDRDAFAWAPALEAATGAIRAELLAVLADGNGIEPYIPKLADRAYTEADTLGLLDDPGWSAYNLVQNGSVIEQNAARCPQTMAALKDVPLCRGDGRAPSVLFSLLRPGVRIPPHHGFTNARLICHLPLIVPSNCGALRVGNESRPWREGELMLFDDSMEHEAWNNSGELRAVLLFDVWRPELSQMERGLVSTMLASIRQAGGVAPA